MTQTSANLQFCEQLHETFQEIPVAGLALFAYIGHMSAGFLTYKEEVQGQSEDIAIETVKPSCNLHNSSVGII